MVSDITEGQLITIKCTVDSAPVSSLTLTTPNSPYSPDWSLPHCYPSVPPNTLCNLFNVTSNHAGSYTCTARNGVGNKRDQKKLVVKCEYIFFLLIKQIMFKPERSIQVIHLTAVWKEKQLDFKWQKSNLHHLCFSMWTDVNHYQLFGWWGGTDWLIMYRGSTKWL